MYLLSKGTNEIFLSFQGCPEAAVDAVVEMVRGLNAQQRAQILQTLSQQGEDQQS